MQEIEAAVQTFNYQINSMSTTNGQAPFLSVYMDINENPEYIFISDAREQFEKVTRLNNDLSLNILKSNNKEII